MNAANDPNRLSRRGRRLFGALGLFMAAVPALSLRAAEPATAPPPASAPAPAPVAASPVEPADSVESVESLLKIIESLQGAPEGLRAAAEFLARRADEVRAAARAEAEAADALAARLAVQARTQAEAAPNLDEERAELAALRSELDKARAELAAAIAGPGKLDALDLSRKLLDTLAAAKPEKKPAVAADAKLDETKTEVAPDAKPVVADAKPADAAKPEVKPVALEAPKAEAAKPADAKPTDAKPDPAKPDAKPEAAALDATPEEIEFFEKKIRPVLAENCFKCHGPDKQKGGLRVDARATIIKGGSQGPAIVAGDPKYSVLIQAIRYETDVLMPPTGKMSDEIIADFEEWVRMGAPWPGMPAAVAAVAADPAAIAAAAQAAAGPAAPADPIALAKQTHWAYKPISDPAPPAVKNASWVATPIDAFALARMEAEGLAPSPVADRRTLIRRAYQDLWGLPPTLAEIAEFEADTAPHAWEKLIDRLLASPHYGERWGRHWLDVARYADTKGYVFQEERRYPFSHTYRDYVIEALNNDKPYDRFILEQLAADQLDLGEDKRPLAAMGFLTLGRRFLNNRHDIIDDRIDVVGRGLMGMTIACARCHDHKFDPIPTADYYSLYGVFASSVEPPEPPLIAEPQPGPLLDEYNNRLKDLETEVDNYFRSKHNEFLGKYRAAAADYLLAAQDGLASESEDAFQAMARDRGLSHHIVRRWQELLKKAGAANNPVLAPWVALAAIPAVEFEARAPETLAAIVANKIEGKPINAQVAAAFAAAPADKPIKTLKDAAEVYRGLLAAADAQWADALQSHSQRVAAEGADKDPAPERLADPAWEEVRLVNFGADAPGNPPSAMVKTLMSLEEQAQLRNRGLAVDAHKASHPGRPPRAHAMNDAPTPINPYVFLRGGPGNKGPEVPRQFLAVLSPAPRKPFEHGSGRLEMAQAIASRDNPLTSRVFVNRVWMWHFGKPLVATPSDFGLRGDAPTHPELLDWLARRFMDDGWSIKKLHKLMMMSNVYQQASVADDARAAKDPENKLLWRFNRRRMDFESMRDSLLLVAGKLDPAMGGPAVEIDAPPFAPRRSVYGFIDRQNLPNLFRTFDLANPDSSSPRRFETTVPQQALFMMNSPFVLDLARSVESREEVKSADGADHARRLFEVIYSREPKPEEVDEALAFVGDPVIQNSSPPVDWLYGWGAFDRETHALKSFEKLPHFGKGTWSGGEKMPENPLNWTSLTAKGGHPGSSADQSVVRRWTAPRAALVRVVGSLKHASDQGDGVAGHILSSRLGELGAWTAFNSTADARVESVEVARGDTIDFVVDPISNQGFDSFQWAPKIEVVEEREAANAVGAGPNSWDAAAEFAGPAPAPLDPWAEYAQVLLSSNEFAFVD